MSASKDQSNLNAARGAGTTFGPGSNSSEGTPAMSVGSATAAGHGDHPRDNADDSKTEMPSSKIGPPKEDLDGEQMSMLAEGKVMDSQLNKKDAGWGEEGSLTSDLDRQKAEQKDAREAIKSARQSGQNVDGGAGQRLQNEGLTQA